MIRESRENPSCRPLRRGVIISPGALGDNLLMLPLAQFMKNSLALDQVEFIGHTPSIGFWPGRSCVDRIRDIERIAFHRLFAAPKELELADGDPLIAALAGYEWIASFLGAGHADFESNLLFTIHCSHAADVAVLPLKPTGDYRDHVSRFYVEAFRQEVPMMDGSIAEPDLSRPILWPRPDDTRAGHLLLEQVGLEPTHPLAVLHPGSGGAAKCWPVENFCLLAGRLAAEGFQVVFLIGPVEEERLRPEARDQLAEAGTCLERAGLSQVLQVLTCADLFCGNDSGVTHLAAGLGCPTVAVFGPSDARVYRPCGPHVEVVAEAPDRFSKISEAMVDRVAQAARRLPAST